MSARLSKSRFQTGLQCPKALWFTTHQRELADPITETQQHIFDTGTAVGELARNRFSGGILVAEDHRQSAQALETTRRLLDNPPPAIYEAALEHEGVFIRADVLVQVNDGVWDLYEVKSGTRVKPENITDAAVQAWVIEGAGLNLRRIHLMHLDGTYSYPGGEYDLERLFLADDVTQAARAFVPQVPGLVAEMFDMLARDMPEVPIGKHCDSPHTCAFYKRCHAFMPDHPVTALPRISAELLDSLIARRIYAIEDIPLNQPGLNAGQREVIQTVREGVGHILGDPRASLDALTFPLHFLDFETMMSALPIFPGTHAWQTIPFQWSDHVLHENGDLEHREFLHEGTGDPRPMFLSTLLDALGDDGSVVVYSPYESSRLRELAAAYPLRAAELARVQTRLFDLLVVVRQHVRHPDTMGSSSIKAILPALVDDLSYDGLGIAEGNTASLRYLKTATGVLTSAECAEVYQDLREYCSVDTLAMVRLYQELLAQ